MARIPFAEVQVESPGQVVAPPLIDTERLGREAFAGAGALSKTIGEGIEQGAKVADKIMQARAAVDVSNAATDAASDLQQARFDLERDPDVAGRLGKFQTKAEEIKQKHLAKVGGYGTDDFLVRFNQLAKPVELEVRTGARNEEIQQHKLDLSTSLEKLANTAVFAKTPLEREAAQAEADKQITQAVNTGYLKASDAQSLKRAYLGKVDESLAAEQVRLNPSGAIAQLGDPNAFPNLDAAARVRLRAMAQQRAESLSAQARAELHYDVTEFGQVVQDSIAHGTPMPPEADYKALQRRAGNSALGVRLQHIWQFGNDVQANTAGKSIPEIQAEANRRTIGVPPPAAPTIADQFVPPTGNLAAARQAMPDLTAQEEALYLRHLGNVAGAGGIDRPGGARSTLSVTGTDIDGRYYLIPTIEGGKELTPAQAIDRAKSLGLEQFPSYPNRQVAEARYAKLHGFMERDVPRAPTIDDLRLAQTLRAVAARKIAEKARDPQLQGDVDTFMGAIGRIAQNKPGPGEDELNRLVERAGGADTPTGSHLIRAYALGKQIEAGLTKTPEELRRDVEEMTRPGAPAYLLEQAHQLSVLAQHKEEQRRADPALHADLEQFGKILADVPNGGRLPSQDTFKPLLERVGGPESAQGYALQRAYNLASSVSQDLTTKSLPELTQLINGLQGTNATPEDLARAHMLSIAAQAKIKARDQDEAAYVLKNYPTISEQMAAADRAGASGDAMQQAAAADVRKIGWAQMLAAQQREGVAPYKMALLTKPALDQVKSNLVNSNDPQVRADEMAKLRAAYGDFWPIVQRQLWEGKPAPPDLQVLGGLPVDAELPRQLVAEAFKVTDKQADDLLGTRVKSIRDEVRKAAAGMDASLVQAPDGMAFAGTYHAAIEKVAQLYAMRGTTSDADAARNAAATVFYDHFALADAVHGVSVRIPKEKDQPVVDPSAVSQAQRSVMAALPSMELAIPGEGNMPGTTEAQRKAGLVNAIRSNGFWMTTAGDDGMMLMTGPNGRNVRFADGRPVVMSFDAINAWAAQSAVSGLETQRLISIQPTLETFAGAPTMGTLPPAFTDPAAVSLPSKLIGRYLDQPPPGSTAAMPVPALSESGRPPIPGGQSAPGPASRLRLLPRPGPQQSTP